MRSISADYAIWRFVEFLNLSIALVGMKGNET